MDEEVQRLRTVLEDSEKLAEDVLVLKQRLIDNDRERNKIREAMAALRRIAKTAQQSNKDQVLQESGLQHPSTNRRPSKDKEEFLMTHTSSSKPNRANVPPQAEGNSVLNIVSSSRTTELLQRGKITAPARSPPLIEELPSSGLDLRGEASRQDDGPESAARHVCSHCGQEKGGGVAFQAPMATTGLRNQPMWMAFPLEGPADGTRAPALFFLAPTMVVQEQLRRDLASLDDAANDMREKQKVAVTELSDKGALESEGALVRALTSLRSK